MSTVFLEIFGGRRNISHFINFYFVLCAIRALNAAHLRAGGSVGGKNKLYKPAKREQ